MTNNTAPQTTTTERGPAVTSLRQFFLNLIAIDKARKALGQQLQSVDNLNKIVEIAKNLKQQIEGLKDSGTFTTTGFEHYLHEQSYIDRQDVMASNHPYGPIRRVCTLLMSSLVTASLLSIPTSKINVAGALIGGVIITTLNEVRHHSRLFIKSVNRWRQPQNDLASRIESLEDSREKDMLNDFAKAARITLNTACAENAYNNDKSQKGLKYIKKIAKDTGLSEPQTQALEQKYLSGIFNDEGAYNKAMATLGLALTSIEHTVGAREITLIPTPEPSKSPAQTRAAYHPAHP